MMKDIGMMLLGDFYLTTWIDPACGLRLLQVTVPDVLFCDHPERRYYSDNTYDESDAISCQETVTLLVKEMLRLHIDGFFEGEFNDYI